ncbi:MAG: hypothetical protein LKK19_04265 [Bacteroidales bacterium]|jgi:hypothetical protein|nr:hypothetical protein [Bacteroidales bacterium]MCI2121899.1 hypothetical protein [Bacteroidales bacterium]MCI2145519.1 hypothetical protein [Bacteroidales bacterium]
MIRIKLVTVLFASATLIAVSSCSTGGNYGPAVVQKRISRVSQMPDMPEPYKMLDWRQKAIDFDAYAFDFDSGKPAGSLIWIDSNQRNIPQITFGLYTAIHDRRQGPHRNGGEFHESLNSLSSILGSGLVGIDKTHQNGYNYVKMVQNYFNSATGWNIMMNNTCPDVAELGGGYGRDWWYDVFPNVLYYAVCDVFPKVENSDNIQRSIAEQFCKADSVLDGDYDYSYFDYGTMQGKVNDIPMQQDAAGGHGYVLYAAYEKYGEPRYLKHAEAAISALESQNESRFYEILMPMGIYTAARLNAEQGCSYDIAKMLGWVFDGCSSSTGRTGWGVICGRWGKYDVSGLQGSTTDGGGYAFLMNSIDMAWPLVPMVKYDPEYARAIGKWMLNDANAARLFFPDMIPDSNQCLPGMQQYTNSVISYEGLSYGDRYGIPGLKGVHPVALGDGPKWAPDNPKESMFSVYSTSPVGIFGAIIDTTDVSGILRLNCNATDFYAERAYPVYLYYNPYGDEKAVTYKAGEGRKDIFDMVSKKYLARNVRDSSKIVVPGDCAVLAVELPAGSRIRKKRDGKLEVNGKIIAYK